MSDLCPVAVVRDSTEDEFQPETASESHLLLLKQKKYCDVTFTFPNLPDRIEAHEFCLKARSPVFAKIFRMRKSGNVQGSEIEISESTPDTFQQFLEFIYADKFEVDIAGALDLLQLAQKYKVHPLTKKCEDLLQTEIPVVYSVKVFETARRYGRRGLMNRAGQIMVKSFLSLVRTGALANADEETLIYLLESYDLAVQEVELFQFMVDWGRNQVENLGDDGPLKNKLKNLISKIRYTNMAPDEFSKVVVPTGLLSAEEIVSVYAYLCGDEVTREGLKTKFNTTRRKVKNQGTAEIVINFFPSPEGGRQGKLIAGWFPTFSKHCISFKAHLAQVDGKKMPDYLLKKTVITAINFWWPCLHTKYKYQDQYVLNFNVSIGEYSRPLKQGNSTIRFEKKLLHCKPNSVNLVSVEPPVELVSRRTYSVIVEDHSTSDSMTSFRKDPEVYLGGCSSNTGLDVNVGFEDVSMILKEVRRQTDYYDPRLLNGSAELDLIRGIHVGLH